MRVVIFERFQTILSPILAANPRVFDRDSPPGIIHAKRRERQNENGEETMACVEVEN